MLSFLSDENFNHDIVRGLLTRRPDLDILNIHEAGLAGADDPTILAWAAEENRVVLTHDKSTMAGYAYQRVIGGEKVPGVIEVPKGVSIGQVIEDILILVECAEPHEVRDRVTRVPL